MSLPTHTQGARSQAERTAPGSGRYEAPSPSIVLAVAAGGAVGGALRYGFILAFPVVPGAFPFVIFMENLVGAFLLALVLALLLRRWRGARHLGAFLTTGVLGSFTTFSNFTLDFVALTIGGSAALALAYGVASVAFGLAAAVLGSAVAHALLRGGR
jgi:fluoride exporter